MLPPLVLALAAAAPVLGCDAAIPSAFQEFPDGRRIEDTFEVRRAHDQVFGPLALRGLRDYTERGMQDMADRDQWMKTIALVRPGRRVSLTIPVSQRAWMRFAYGDARYRVIFRACGGERNSAWAGGFDIDYAKAPQNGRCARLAVRAGDRVIRKRLFPRAGRC
jgi:hypothetical protein